MEQQSLRTPPDLIISILKEFLGGAHHMLLHILDKHKRAGFLHGSLGHMTDILLEKPPGEDNMVS